MFEKCQHARTASLFPPYCVDFPCNTQSIAASNRLVWRKNLSPLGTFPIFKQGLVILVQNARLSTLHLKELLQKLEDYDAYAVIVLDVNVFVSESVPLQTVTVVTVR